MTTSSLLETCLVANNATVALLNTKPGTKFPARLSHFFVMAAVVLTCFSAKAAPSDCMGVAADGTAKCTRPVISPRSYGICIRTLFSLPDAALSRCYAKVLGSAGAVITSDQQATAIINCLPNEYYGPNATPGSVSLTWASDGQNFPDNNICGNLTATSHYGIEMLSWALTPAAALNFSWDVVTVRGRQPECPLGYSPGGGTAQYPDYCVKPSAQRCVACGDPIVISSGERTLSESDYPRTGPSPLRFGRSFSTLGHYRPVGWTGEPDRGFNDFWRHTYSRRIYAENSPSLLATAIREDGSEKHFRADGLEISNAEGSGDVLTQRMSGTQRIGWFYRSGRGELETYDVGGALTSLQDANGLKQSMIYSDATTPTNVAPVPGLLIAVVDDFGRRLQFTYNAIGQMVSMTAPDGSIYAFGFDEYEMLRTVAYPDTSSRTYTYGESGYSGDGRRTLTGVYDERNIRVITNSYRSLSQGWLDSSAHANGTDLYVRTPGSNNTALVQDPLGGVRTYAFQSVNGVDKLVSQSSPAGSGSPASTRFLTYDAKGNLASEDDFNGNRKCLQFDLGRNLETLRVEGLPGTAPCALMTPVGADLPSGSRAVATQWHPVWRLEVQRSEPRKRTTWVYNGQPDPFNSNAIANCAATAPALADGSPLAVMCKKVEQATNDSNGAFASGNTVTVQAPDADPKFANVSLLLHMNGANGSTTFSDSSANAVVLTRNANAQISTAQSKFGGAAGKFDGALGWLDATSPALNLSGGDFTIEFWVYLNNSSAPQVLYSQYPTGVDLGVDPGGDVYFQPAGATYINTGAGTLAAGSWYHLAFVRYGSTTSIYVNGIQKATSTALSGAGSSSSLSIGARYANHLYTLNGYMDDLRVTKGVARYLFEFTPPASAFGNSVAGTGGSTTLPMIDASVPARTWTYTYNQVGQVLTAKGPRTDVNDTTTYAYYADTTVDHMVGDLSSITNAAGHITRFTKYDKAGRVLQRVDPTGAITDTTYKPRGWVDTVTLTPAGGGTQQVTSHVYDAAGKLKQVNMPDGTSLVYAYDDAHRLTGVTDAAGNTVTYTLDNAGNRTGETVKDASGNLVRSITRVFDALGRVQQVTGASQ